MREERRRKVRRRQGTDTDGEAESERMCDG